jgi:hypothetical protein
MLVLLFTQRCTVRGQARDSWKITLASISIFWVETSDKRFEGN